jgi:hypothetical protein
VWIQNLIELFIIHPCAYNSRCWCAFKPIRSFFFFTSWNSTWLDKRRPTGHFYEAHLRIYCHVSGVPWLIITGFGLDDWIYWHLLVQSLNHNQLKRYR